MKPRILTTVLVCSSILMTAVAPAIAATTPTTTVTGTQTKAAQSAESIVKDFAFVDLQLKNGQLFDAKGQTNWVKNGNPVIAANAEVGGEVLKLDGQSAFYTTFSNQQFDQLKNGMAIEAYFKYDSAADYNSEHEIFSGQEAGGLGLGVQHGRVTFYAHDGNGYKQPSGELRAGHWVHAVGVIDKNKTASLYLDGKLVQKVKMPGGLKLARHTKDFVLGGDAHPGNHVQSQMTGKIKLARLYNHTLSTDQVATLNREASAQTHENPLGEPKVGTMMVGAKGIAVGHTYGLNVHAHRIEAGEPGTVTMDVVYNPNKLQFVNADQTLGGSKTTVTQVVPGRLRITSTANLTQSEFKQYAKTRLAHVNFTALQAGNTQITFEQASPAGNLQLGTAQALKIHGKYELDYNGDGVIGIGDLVKAPAEKRAAVIKNSEIKPYKHVVVLTTDGGGRAWDPNGMYFDPINLGFPVWTTSRQIMKKRHNPYVMDLFNNKFAMSTTAKSVTPAISAQNYISMLHGRPWASLPKEYQGTNDSMGQEYFADFGKQQAQFPSVFKILQQNNPTQGGAAFSEWGAIANAIVEPDAAVKTKQSASLKSFDDVANYIGTPEFDSTAMVYMQSDYMDHTGHSKGWFNNNYWKEYQRYDELFKKVMDKLESTGHIHDTLVIANADHGGAGHNHGGSGAPSSDIFIALGGDTVRAGQRLKGGSNADITALVLNALQVPHAPHMLKEYDGSFAKDAFMTQAELAQKKDRGVEKVSLHQRFNSATIDLDSSKTHANQPLSAIDMEINLNGRKVAAIKAKKGVKVLRQEISPEGTLKLTLDLNKKSAGKLVKINFKGWPHSAAKQVSLEKAMAARANGTEVYVDLANVK